MSSTIDAITLDVKRPAVQLEHALSNYFKSIESKNKEIHHPHLKVFSSANLEKTAVEDRKKLLSIKAKYDDAKKSGNKEEAEKFKKEFEALKAKKSKATADIIDLNDIEFVKNFDKEFIETKKDEPLNSHISDPELRGLIDILSQPLPKTEAKTESKSESKTEAEDKKAKAEEKKVQKSELQRQKMKKILKSLGLEVHGSHLSSCIKKFSNMLGDMNYFRLKTLNGLYKPLPSKNETTKRYFLSICKDFDSIFAQYIDGDSKEEIISKASKNKFALAHYTEKKVEFGKLSKEEKDEAKEEMKKLKSIDTTVSFLSLHKLEDLKEHYDEYQKIMKKIGKIAGTDFELSDAISFVKSIVKASQNLNAVKTFSKDDKEGKIKESMIGNAFIKDLLSEIPVKITPSLRKKIFTSISENKEIELTKEEVEIFETYEGGITSMSTFENLSTVSDTNLKNCKVVRQAIGIRLFTEALRRIDKMIIAHGGKTGFTATIYY